MRLGAPARIAIATALAACPLASASDLPAAPATRSFEADVKPVLERSCYACHNSALKNADLNLQAYETEADVLKDDHTWSKVVQKVRTRVMPAPPFPPLSDDEVGLVTGWIEAVFERADAAAPPDPGRVTARRLNRTEYNNTVRDLLGVDLQPGRRVPAGRLRLRLRQHRRRAVAVAGADGEVPGRGRARRARGALRPPSAQARRLVRLPSARARVEATHGRPGELRRDRPQPAQRLPRHPPRPGRRRVRRARDPRRRAAGGLRADRASRSGSTASRSASQALDPEGAASFSSRPSRTSRARRVEFRLRLPAGEHSDRRRRSPRIFEGLPRELRRPASRRRCRRRRRASSSRRPDATPERIANAAQALRGAAGGARCRSTTRASARIDVGGPYDAGRGRLAREPRALYTCGHLAAAARRRLPAHDPDASWRGAPTAGR